MSYKSYLRFYKLADTKENHENWLYSEWTHGRLYMYNNKFYSVETNKEVK